MFDQKKPPYFVGTDKVVCIYHRRCWDGSVAAWIVKKAAPHIEFIAANYGEDPPPLSELMGKHVVIVDFSYPRDVLEMIASETLSLMVLDHHETAQEDLKGLPFAKFDMEQSGAALAWETFFPRKQMPLLVRYVQDYDLWRFDLPHSEEINVALHSFELSNETLDKLEIMLEENPFLFAVEGKAILRYRDHLVGTICDMAIEMEIEGNNVLGAECPRELRDHVAGRLAAGRLFGVAFQTKAKDGFTERAYSLRVRDGDFPVNKVAKVFGGGGHPGSAAFSRKLEGSIDSFQVVDPPMLEALKGQTEREKG